MELIILAPVLELFPDARADQDSLLLGVDGHVSAIEQGMQIAAQKESIGEFVRAAECIGADVRSLQHGQCPLVGNRTAALISVRDQNSESTLPQPRHDESCITETSACGGNQCRAGILQRLT